MYNVLKEQRLKDLPLFITRELDNIFNIFGNPRIIQHDQGSEFRGEVSTLLKQRGITDISSATYHPQSQGKVERLHRTLKSKILFDLLVNKQKGINWVKELPSYTKLLIEDPKEVLGWKSPFEIFFGRKPETNYISRQKTNYTIHG